ncbi:galanin receptor 2b-like [Lytechinus pictus]|uniref:galanin receptor 2b-like n=1 Tax=Lytechinus pictus TaxID=7653 RepID=UPI0030B9F0FC
MAISVERFVAIVYPIQFARFRNRRHINEGIISIWGLSLVVNLFIPLTMHVSDESNQCKVEFMTYTSQIIIGVMTALVCYIIPISVMLVTNVTAARKLHRQFKRFRSTLPGEFNGQSTASLNLLHARKRVLYMLILVVIIYAICWGPNTIAYFLYNIRILDPLYLYGPVDRILVLLAFYNSCANPIVYTLRYPRFRKALRNVFTCSKVSSNAIFEFNNTGPKTNDGKDKITMTAM